MINAYLERNFDRYVCLYVYHVGSNFGCLAMASERYEI